MNIKSKELKTCLLKKLPGKTINDRWDLRLYIVGQTKIAVTALNNLKSICEEQLNGKYHIKVIDLLKQPKFAHEDNIFAIPTLKRKSPLPVRSIIGDLSNTERVLVGLNLKGK
jgi:circadian clock protein KaiB